MGRFFRDAVGEARDGNGAAASWLCVGRVQAASSGARVTCTRCDRASPSGCFDAWAVVGGAAVAMWTAGVQA